MPFLEINDARLWYEEMGQGEPILLHHGYTACRDNWLPVAELLRDEYRVVVIECRGCGESEHTEGGYNLEQYADDAVSLMHKLGYNRFTFVGHSMGGGVGMTIALGHTEVLERLVLVASVGSKGLQGQSFRSNVDDRLAARKRGDREFFRQEQLAGRFREDVQTDEWIELRVHHMMNVVSDGHLIDSMKAMQSMDLTDDLQHIHTPTLVLAGGVDPLLQANIEDYFRLPDACLQVFFRSAHEVGIHETEGVADAIRQFMRHGALNADTLKTRNAFYSK